MAIRASDVQDVPLTPEEMGALGRLVGTLDRDRLNWVSGYLAGVAQRTAAPPDDVVATERQTLTVLYGSETGNAERLASEVATAADHRGIGVRVVDMADYKLRELRDEQFLMIIAATHGEGTPPDRAADFYEFVHGRKVPQLDHLRFAVLALGDSSYEYFCQTGRDFDTRLEALGARRLTDRLDCDVDFAEAASHWIATALDAFGVETQSRISGGPIGNVLEFARPRKVPEYGRDHPFAAEVLENFRLNGRGSVRETHHVELSVVGSGFDYLPGDVLGVVPRNRPAVVDALIEELTLDPAASVTVGAATKTFREALLTDYEVTTVTPKFLQAWAELSEAKSLLDLVVDDAAEARRRYAAERWIIDVIGEYPTATVQPDQFLSLLPGLKPREYSIASSSKANPDEAHLTVSAVRYLARGESRFGVASTFLADALEPGDRVDVFLRENKHFRLPAEPETPLIMIGPGTGVAPFRAFLQEREVIGAGGPNWLVFGNPHFRTDFLYQTEWQRWLADGLLTRLDVAFSRDQEQKIYVQHRLTENGGEVYRWLEEGAHLYVCGDAERMAPDVHAALLSILQSHGGLSEDASHDYLKRLRRENRYQRDVY